MQELSVTGATLLVVDHHHQQLYQPTNSSRTTTVSSSSSSQHPHQNCPHHRHHHHDTDDHGHSHDHHNHSSHGSTDQNNMMMMMQQRQQTPTIQLKKPANELVSEYNDRQMMTMVNQIVRLGSYELLREVIVAWRDGRKPLPVDLHGYDDNGHTLTHWAAKRIDDRRFIAYFLDSDEVPFGNDPDDSNQQRQDDKTTATSDIMTTKSSRYDSPLQRPTLDDTKMTPVHWVCTIGGTGAIAILQVMNEMSDKDQKKKRVVNSIFEVRDGTNCTPLLIAAQHGHVDTCAYLIQRGADLKVVDTSRDTATHWAAYKGSELVLGLLSFYDIAPLRQPDLFGQTPLHLAALRGNIGTVRYIIQQLSRANHSNNATTTTTNRAHQRRHNNNNNHSTMLLLKDVLNMKDTNGRTPYELAVHKQQHAVAELLRQIMVPNYWSSMKQMVSIRTIKSWLGLLSNDDISSPKLPYYYVWFQIGLHLLYLFGVFIPIFDTGNGVLWDYLTIQLFQLVLIGLICYVLQKTTYTNPGRLDQSHPAYAEYRKLYELSISGCHNNTGTGEEQQPPVQVCHSCHVARPLRSKHCRITGCCILAFDHHCPFVGTTVGLYNYTWFYLFLLLLTIYLINFWFLLCVYYQRTMSQQRHPTTHNNHDLLLIVIIGAILGLHIFFPAGMLIYHTQLTGLNLTTNEHLNLFKYQYLRPHRPYSPWDRGFCTNFLDRIVSPSERSYELPNSPLQSLLQQHRDGGSTRV